MGSKCVDLAHSIRLDPESLESSLFTTFTGGKNWLPSIIAILPSLGKGQEILPGTPVVPTGLLTEHWGVRFSLMNWGENTWAGPLPLGKRGDSSYWRICSTMLPPWRRKSGEGAYEDHRLRKPNRWPLNTLCEGPHRHYWWCHYPSDQTRLLRGVDLGSQHPFPSSAQWLHEGIMAGVEQTYS